MQPFVALPTLLLSCIPGGGETQGVTDRNYPSAAQMAASLADTHVVTVVEEPVRLAGAWTDPTTQDRS